MKRILLWFSALLLLSGVVPRPAEAQKSYALGIAGGAAMPVGRLTDTQNTGWNGMIALAIGVPELPIGLRFDGIFNRLPRRDIALPQSGSAALSNLRINGAIGNLIYAFSGTSAKPYLIAGAGWYSTKQDLAGAAATNSIGFNVGLGSTFGIGPLATFIESRYHSISRSAAKGGVIQFVPVTLGLMF
ncbi:MAG: hypothetical protein ABR585_00710 [Gemmatimonadaceae bacterium]